MQWLRNIIFKWLELVYGEEYIRQDHVRKNFTQFLYHAYTHARIEQLFEIIIGIYFQTIFIECCNDQLMIQVTRKVFPPSKIYKSVYVEPN